MGIGTHKVEIAFNAGFTTAAGSRTWTDVTAYIEGNQQINISRGRTDRGAVPPAKVSLTLNNRDGRFTPEKTGGAYYPNVKLGRPIRVTSTYNAVAYVRYLGFVDSWTPGWPDGSDADAVTTVTASSRLARLGRSAELKSIVEEEILLDSPIALFTLSEPEGATSAADSSESQQAALTMVGSGSAVTFGSDTGPGTDGLTAAHFAGGKYLAGSLASAPAAIELWFATTGTDEWLLSDGEASAGSFGLFIDGTGKVSAISTAVGSAVNDGSVHHVCISSGQLVVDGTTYTPSIPTPPATMYVGGSPSTAHSTLTGSLAHLACYSSTPSGARLMAHYQSGSTGFAGDLSGARISRYASYAGVPSTEVSIDTGLATVGHVDTTGNAPVELMRKVETTEGGVLFDAKDGTLTFKDRDARYNAAASFTLSAAAQEIEADLNPDYDDQYLLNDVTASANGTPAGRVTDSTSTSDVGYYRDSLDTVSTSTDDALAGAQWLVALRKDPRTRYSPVSVDVVNSSTSQAAAVLGAEIGTRFDLSGLPTQAAASTAELFVEGYSEVITSSTHRIAFNTSPTYGYTGSGGNGVWQLQVAGRSELGDTTRLAF